MAECVEVFNRDGGYGAPQGPRRVVASLHHDGSAIRVALGEGGECGAVWVLLRGLRRDGAREEGDDARAVEVDSVRVFPASESHTVRPLALAPPSGG